MQRLLFCLSDPQYPERLREVDDPPGRLYVKGAILPRDSVAVSIVGTRSPTPTGKLIAYEMAGDLASAGVTVVSGLALGIDAESHRGALDAGGRTLACLGCGVDVTYPRSNVAIARRIPGSGALVSEYPPGTSPQKWHFPARNRLISGLSLGVVVVEAGEKSGALITANWALAQSRAVMAVPGNPRSAASIGSNRLIQDGAYLVTSAADVLSFLGREYEYVPSAIGTAKGCKHELTLEEGAILEAIRGKALTADEVSDAFPTFSPAKVIAVLSVLEIRGIVKNLAGGRYLANS